MPPGRSIGVWQPAEMKGYELAAEPGAPAWHELHTKDYATAVKFYQDVFGWDTDVMSDTPEFRYTTLGAGDAAKAGIMDASAYLPAEVPSNWQVYFAVEDAEASIEKAVSMGAKVIDGPDDTPFGGSPRWPTPPAPCSRSSLTPDREHSPPPTLNRPGLQALPS